MSLARHKHANGSDSGNTHANGSTPATAQETPFSVAQAIALAEEHSRAGKLPAAMALCRDILRTKPSHAPALHLLAIVTYKAGNLSTAMELIRRAIGADGANERYHRALGGMCRLVGQLDEALTAFDTAIALNPREAANYFNLCDLKTFAPGDPHLAAMEELAGEIASHSIVSQILLHFALAKAYEDLGRYDESFQHLAQGNVLKRRQIVYDETQSCDMFERIRTTFDHQLVNGTEGMGYPSPIPVFIVGMPRSGTTLIEQILASHPAVHGAGELNDLGHQIVQLRTGPEGEIRYPESGRSLSSGQLQQLGRGYTNGLRRRAPDAKRITDKAALHYLHLGLIHLALPEARIIHVKRSPLDTCFSCYSKLFNHGQDFAYDLGELGRYYRRYDKLMAHWRDVLPPDRFLEIRYEAVIADLESEARRFVGFCGLQWDPRCLAFHQTRRPVFTASATQVRRPIYQSSQGRWLAYRDHLGPLIAALGDLVDPTTVVARAANN
jgi:tetratricopeptide (TPR) repeat protein